MIGNNILVFSFVTGILLSLTICNLHRIVLNMIWYCFFCLISWFLLSREFCWVWYFFSLQFAIFIGMCWIWYDTVSIVCFRDFLSSRECAESCSALELEKCSIQGLLSGILQLLCLMARFARVRYLAVSEFLHEVCLNYYNTPSLCFTYLASSCQAVSCLKVYFQLWRQCTTRYI